ncbi:MAG: hypothetical protein ABI220_00505 [Candidatus Saccharimonadales bacterium]
MASENQYNRQDLPPSQPAFPPLIVDGTIPEHQSGGTFYEIKPAGLSIFGLAHWALTHRGGRGMPTEPSPSATSPEYPDTPINLPVIHEVNDPSTANQKTWRTAVMHTLGMKYLDSESLKNRLPGKSDTDISKLIVEMHNRGIIGGPSRMGYQVLQKYGDSPEAIYTVALHLTQVRARQARNAIDGLTNTYRIQLNQGLSHTQARLNYNQGSHRVLDEIHNYASDLTTAVDSLNIPYAEIHRIVNKLEHVGFLRVPVTDRGTDFDDGLTTRTPWFEQNKSWAQFHPRYERSGSRVYLVSNPNDQQRSIDAVYERFPVDYNPNEVVLPPERGRRDGRRSDHRSDTETDAIEWWQEIAQDPQYHDLFDLQQLSDLYEDINDETRPIKNARLDELNLARTERLPADDYKTLITPISVHHIQEYLEKHGYEADTIPNDVKEAIKLASLGAKQQLTPRPRRPR